MKIFDRYIFKRFFILFCLIYLSLFSLFIILDISSNMSDFRVSGISKWQLCTQILAYYSLYFFRLVDFFFPMMLLASGAATLVYMWNKNELIALLATGISPARILAPIIVCSFCVTMGFTVFREVYVPSQLVNLAKNPKDFVSKADEIEVNRAVDDKSKLSIDGEKIAFSESKLTRPKVMLNSNLNRYGNRIIAKSATFCPPEGDRPSGWRFSGVTSPSEITKNESLFDSQLGEKIIFSPYDTQWLNKDEVFVATNLTPTQMIAGDNWYSYGALNELFSALKDPAYSGRVHKIAIHAYMRRLRPISDMIPIFLGLPMAFCGRGKSIYRMLSYGAVLAALYVVFQLVCLFLGDSLRIAAIAIWAPIVVFAPIAANIYADLYRKEY